MEVTKQQLIPTAEVVITELIVQPHIAPTSDGGDSDNDDQGWRDEDKEKKKNPYYCLLEFQIIEW